jgi:hypothetical protein
VTSKKDAQNATDLLSVGAFHGDLCVLRKQKKYFQILANTCTIVQYFLHCSTVEYQVERRRKCQLINQQHAQQIKNNDHTQRVFRKPLEAASLTTYKSSNRKGLCVNYCCQTILCRDDCAFINNLMRLRSLLVHLVGAALVTFLVTLAATVSLRLGQDQGAEQQTLIHATTVVPVIPAKPKWQKIMKKMDQLNSTYHHGEEKNGGGIIFFVHTIKTGGTTIRDNFSNKSLFPHVDYIAVYSLQEFRKKAKPKIAARLSGNAKTQSTLFLEIHGHNTPSLIELEPMLREWKAHAATTAVPFFVFTLLRDPLDFAVSYFNFFYVYGDPRFGPPMKATLPNLQKILPWNPQCLYLTRGERPFFRPDKYYNVTPSDCHDIARVMDTVLDWVGDTSQLSTETLPLLVMLITGTSASQELLATMRSSNVAATRKQRNRPLFKSQLDALTINMIRMATQLDQQLYQQHTDKLVLQ